MNKTIFLAFIILAGLGISFEVFALELAWPDSPLSPGFTLTDTSTLTDLVRYFYEWGLFIGGLAVFVSLLFGGFLYLTSMGNPARMSEAKDRIYSALIGLVLLFSIYLILNTINPELTILTVPTLESPGETLKGICEATLYDQNDDYIVDLRPGESWNGGTINGDTEIRSVDISTWGMDCELLLYIQKDQGGDDCASDTDCAAPTSDCEDGTCAKIFTESTGDTGAAYLSARNKEAEFIEPCKEAVLYDQNGSKITTLGPEEENCDVEDDCGADCYVDKVEIEGTCNLQMWSETGCSGDYFPISSDTSDIYEDYEIKVKGVKNISKPK